MLRAHLATIVGHAAFPVVKHPTFRTRALFAEPFLPKYPFAIPPHSAFHQQILRLRRRHRHHHHRHRHRHRQHHRHRRPFIHHHPQGPLSPMNSTQAFLTPMPGICFPENCTQRHSFESAPRAVCARAWFVGGDFFFWFCSKASRLTGIRWPTTAVCSLTTTTAVVSLHLDRFCLYA